MNPGAFRMVLAALVAFAHTAGPFVGRPAVYVFFVLSGYWITRMWQERYAHTRAPYFTFVVSRVWRLLPIYWLCYVIALVVAWGTHRYGAAEWAVASDWGWRLRAVCLLGSGGAADFRPLGSAWSLDYEMQFYLLAPLLVLLVPRLNERGRVLGLGLCAALCVVFMLGFHFLPAWVFHYMGFFGIGMVAHLARWRPGTRLVKASMWAFAMALLVLTVGFAAKLVTGAAWTEWLAGWLHWRDALVALLAVPLALDSCHRRSDARDRALGAASYPLYLVQDVVDAFFELTFHGVSMSMKVLLLPVQWGGMALLAWLIWRAVDLPIEKVRQTWLRTRSKPTVTG
jgi:peptidoglycan/LPS O-acetylase OafA/YrhL